MARSPADSARLEGAVAAKTLHRRLELQKRVTSSSGQIDVFDAIAALDIPLLFKPLDALGLCLPHPLRGIMVTTKRGLHIQRFTAAHELGHAVLSHRGSVDREILERGSFVPQNGRDLQEVEADAFAAEFLLPRWLYRHHVQHQKWTLAQLRDPSIVYQLSLRMGASYEATCWGLASHQILSFDDVQVLRQTRVAKLKSAISEQFRPDNSWANVWQVTDRDAGATLTGNPDDLLRVDLDEEVSSGYQWNVIDFAQAGYEILSDSSSFSREPLLYGAPSRRTLIAKPRLNHSARLVLRETQPWRPPEGDDPVFAVNLDLTGPEIGGPSRADWRRRRALL